MTAQEFMDQEKYDYDLTTTSAYFYGGDVAEHFEQIMIEFAKYHVIQALREAFVNAKDYDDSVPSINPESILNAYPLSQIK